MLENNYKYINNNEYFWRKQDAYPFLKGPPLADFMFIVVEHFLPDLDNLVAHILDLCHSLHRNTKKKDSQNCHACFTASHSPLEVKSASPAAKNLHHH